MTSTTLKTPLSMLDLATVREGKSVAEALKVSAQTAQHAESLGFKRYWLAEHHNMLGIASSATAVLIGHIAAQTSTMRVGSGGIMLPNHAPLVVAEAFGTLAELFPDRIDLGLGRAPGTDQNTMRALRRNRLNSAEDFPNEVSELQQLLAVPTAGQIITATPGAGTNVPIWLLGSSLFSAQLAGERGLPYSFASHFAPRMLLQALQVYRNSFKPSATLDKPYVMIGVPVIAADTDEEAEFLASSTYQRILGLLKGQLGKLPAPVENYLHSLHPQEQDAIKDFLSAAVIGGPEKIASGLQELIALTQADELMLVCDIYEPELRFKSMSIAAQS